jgi:hypothetical protein
VSARPLRALQDVRKLLAEQFPDARPLAERDAARVARPVPTGLSALDAALPHGGLPRGKLTAWGPAAGRGRGAALGLPRGSGTRRARGVGGRVATLTYGWAGDARRGGRRLGRCARRRAAAAHPPARPHHALRCAELVLRSGAFALVVLEPPPGGEPVGTETVRLTRATREGGAALVVLTERGAMAALRVTSRLVLHGVRWRRGPFGPAAPVDVRAEVRVRALGWHARAEVTLAVAGYDVRDALDPHAPTGAAARGGDATLGGPPGGGSGAPGGGAGVGGLLAALLAVSPHAVAAPADGGTLVWADGRGLPLRALARRGAAAGARRPGCRRARGGGAGGRGAAVAARWGAPAARPGRPLTAVAPEARGGVPGRAPARGAAARGGRRRHRRGGCQGADAVTPAAAARTVTALADVGLHTCGALAAVAAAAVEVRFGAAGCGSGGSRAPTTRGASSAPRRASGRRPRSSGRSSRCATPSGCCSRGPGSCRACAPPWLSAGEAAGAMTVRFALAGGGAVERPVRAARDTADPTTWRRLLRAEFERVALPDAVCGLALRAETAREAASPQSDLFDRGAGTAGAAAAAVARLVEDEAGRAVLPVPGAHALPERRLAWRAASVDAALGAGRAPVLPRDVAGGVAAGAPPRTRSRRARGSRCTWVAGAPHCRAERGPGGPRRSGVRRTRRRHPRTRGRGARPARSRCACSLGRAAWP